MQKKSRLRPLRTKNYVCRLKNLNLLLPAVGASNSRFFLRHLHLFFGLPVEAIKEQSIEFKENTLLIKCLI